MRNPVRVKNFDVRFAPAFLGGVLLLALSEPTGVSVAVGAPLVVGGLLLRSWAVGHLVKTEQLTVTGPYAHVRHPLYLGTLAIGLGVSAMLGGFAALVACVAVAVWFSLSYLPRKERVESDRLADRYGELYARYRSEVPALWPRWRAFRVPTETGNEPPIRAGDRGEASRTWRASRFDANNELGTVIAVAIAVVAVAWRATI